jgi:hypothetical protein
MENTNTDEHIIDKYPENNSDYVFRIKKWKWYNMITIIGIIIGWVLLEIGPYDIPMGAIITGGVIMGISGVSAIYLIWKQYKDIIGYFKKWKYRNIYSETKNKVKNNLKIFNK